MKSFLDRNQNKIVTLALVVAGFAILGTCAFFGHRPPRLPTDELQTKSAELTKGKTASESESGIANDLVKQGRIGFEAHEWDKAAELWNRLLRDYPNDSHAKVIREMFTEFPLTADSPKAMFCLTVAGECRSHTGNVKDMVLALTMLSSTNFSRLEGNTQVLVTSIMTDLKSAYHDGRMSREQQEAAVNIFGAELFARKL